MRRRHDRETSDLIARQYGERAAGLRHSLEKLFEEKGEARAVAVREAREVAAATAAAQGLDAEAAEAASVAAVEAALAEVDRKFVDKQKDVEASTVGEIEGRHSAEVLALRKRQLAEAAEALEELAPEEAERQRQQAQEEQARAHEELEVRKQALEAERDARIAAIEAQREAELAAIAEAQQQEMHALEEEIAAKLAAEKSEMDAKLAQRRRELEDDQKQRMDAHMEELGGLDVAAREAEKDKLLKKFDADKSAAEAALNSERDQSKRRLEAKLAKRKAAKKRKAEDEAQAKAQEEAVKAEAQQEIVRAGAEREIKMQDDLANDAIKALSSPMKRKLAGGEGGATGASPSKWGMAKQASQKVLLERRSSNANLLANEGGSPLKGQVPVQQQQQQQQQQHMAAAGPPAQMSGDLLEQLNRMEVRMPRYRTTPAALFCALELTLSPPLSHFLSLSSLF